MSEENKPAENKPEEELPQWVRDSISKANNQAAEARIKLREAQNENAGLQQTVSAYQAQLTEMKDSAQSASADLLRLQAALAAEIPGGTAMQIADRLKGSSMDELVEDAKRLRETFSANVDTRVRPIDPSQGMRKTDKGPDPDDLGSFFLEALNKTRK